MFVRFIRDRKGKKLNTDFLVFLVLSVWEAHFFSNQYVLVLYSYSILKDLGEWVVWIIYWRVNINIVNGIFIENYLIFKIFLWITCGLWLFSRLKFLSIFSEEENWYLWHVLKWSWIIRTSHAVSVLSLLWHSACLVWKLLIFSSS